MLIQEKDIALLPAWPQSGMHRKVYLKNPNAQQSIYRSILDTVRLHGN